MYIWASFSSVIFFTSLNTFGDSYTTQVESIQHMGCIPHSYWENYFISSKVSFKFGWSIIFSRVYRKYVPARVRIRGKLNGRTLFARGYTLQMFPFGRYLRENLIEERLQTVSNIKNIRKWGAGARLPLGVLGTNTLLATPTRQPAQKHRGWRGR